MPSTTTKSGTSRSSSATPRNGTRYERDVGHERTLHLARGRESDAPLRSDLAVGCGPLVESPGEPGLPATVLPLWAHFTDGTAENPLRFRLGFGQNDLVGMSSDDAFASDDKAQPMPLTAQPNTDADLLR